MYQQLQIANAQSKPVAVDRLLFLTESVLDSQAAEVKAEGILMDTSPFYEEERTSRGARPTRSSSRSESMSTRSNPSNSPLICSPNPEKDFQTWNDRLEAGKLRRWRRSS